MGQRLWRTGYWSPGKVKDLFGILGKKKGELGEGVQGYDVHGRIETDRQPEGHAQNGQQEIMLQQFFDSNNFLVLNIYF